MTIRHICDLCQGPIEPDTLRGCIHLPKLASRETEPSTFMEALLNSRSSNKIQIRGRDYVIEDLDICEGCVRMLKELRRQHPCGRVG